MLKWQERALERDVRKQKRECMLFDELGDEEAFRKSAVKLKQKEAELEHYVGSKDHLHRRKDCRYSYMDEQGKHREYI